MGRCDGRPETEWLGAVTDDQYDGWCIRTRGADSWARRIRPGSAPCPCY